MFGRKSSTILVIVMLLGPNRLVAVERPWFGPFGTRERAQWPMRTTVDQTKVGVPDTVQKVTTDERQDDVQPTLPTPR
jgi:hypothetical protein